MTHSTIMRGRVDPLQCGCETGGALASVDEAVAAGIASAPPPGPAEAVALEQATGRVLANAVASPLPLPPFDNAAMDGYALSVADLAGEGPWTLPLAGRVRAGDPPQTQRHGMASRILTGAPVPAGADCVVAQEGVCTDGARIVLNQRPAPGANIRRTGEDLAAGAKILLAGRVISAREAAALASVGLCRVQVHPRVRVAVLTTGSELVEPGRDLWPGQIWNANRFQIGAAITVPHVATVTTDALPDDPVRLAEAFARAGEQADMLITTGGVSVGDEDHLPRLFCEAGGTIRIRGVAMKPGKPLTLGRLGRMVWVGLPGNPLAAFVAWTLIGAPILRAMAGIAPATGGGHGRMVARLARPVAAHAGRCEIRPARLVGYDVQGAQVVDCLDGAAAHRVALLAQADGLVVIPADPDGLAAGALVEYLPF